MDAKPTLNKNHAARLKRVSKHLDSALDKLMQANGELWPQELRGYGQELQHAVLTLQELHGSIQTRLNASVQTADPSEEEVDPDQEDIEDVDSVAQPQPAAKSGAQLAAAPLDEDPVDGDQPPAPVQGRRRRAA